MPQWTLDDIPWDQFDRSKVCPELVSLVKAASLVEHNGYDYARYLCEVFADDKAFQTVAHQWAEEEVQHGRALRKWAELADPEFDFDKSFKTFTEGYKLPLNVTASVRGSRCGEMIARCIVEIGTSSYYTAIKDYTDEPALQVVAAKIAADEFRHYKLFYTHLQRYLEIEKLSAFQRFKIVLGRVAESEDDELCYAYYAAHRKSADEVYDQKKCAKLYMNNVGKLYHRGHIDRMISMAFKTVGFKPHDLFNRMIGRVAWSVLQMRAKPSRAITA